MTQAHEPHEELQALAAPQIPGLTRPRRMGKRTTVMAIRNAATASSREPGSSRPRRTRR
jgi:hypothetical protein